MRLQNETLNYVLIEKEDINFMYPGRKNKNEDKMLILTYLHHILDLSVLSFLSHKALGLELGGRSITFTE